MTIIRGKTLELDRLQGSPPGSSRKCLREVAEELNPASMQYLTVCGQVICTWWYAVKTTSQSGPKYSPSLISLKKVWLVLGLRPGVAICRPPRFIASLRQYPNPTTKYHPPPEIYHPGNKNRYRDPGNFSGGRPGFVPGEPRDFDRRVPWTPGTAVPGSRDPGYRGSRFPGPRVPRFPVPGTRVPGTRDTRTLTCHF